MHHCRDHQQPMLSHGSYRATNTLRVSQFLCSTTRSSALIGYGLEAFVDMAASVLVLWRFWESADTEAGARANEDREQRANVLIAFIVSCSNYSLRTAL